MIKRYGLVVFLFCLSIMAGIALALLETVTAFFFSTGILIFGGVVTALFAGSAVSWLVLKRKSHIRNPEQSIRHQGTAFGAWFAVHNLFWAFGGCLFIWGIFKLYGFRWWVMVFSAGALACSCFALTGIFLIRQWNMLGLCWQSSIPDGLGNFWARAGAALILRERYEYAAKQDQRQHTPLLWSISRIFNRANAGGANRGIDLLESRRGFLSKKLKKEWWSRLKILLVLFWVTAALAVLPGILGYAGHHWDRVPDGWETDKPQMMASKPKPENNLQKDKYQKDNAKDEEDDRRPEDKKTEPDREKQKDSDKHNKNSKTGQGRQSSEPGQNTSNRQNKGKQEGKQEGNQQGKEEVQEERRSGDREPGGQDNRESGQDQEGKNESNREQQGKERDNNNRGTSPGEGTGSRETGQGKEEQAKGQKPGQDQGERERQGKGKGQEQGQDQKQKQGQKQRQGEGQEKKKGQDQGQGEGQGKGQEQGQKQGQNHNTNQDQGQSKGEGKGQGEEQGKGQGKGQGKEPGKEQGQKQGQDQGQGKGKGQGNDQAQGEGEGEGQGKGQGKGKGQGQGQGENEGGDGSSSKEENPGEIQSGGAGKGTGEGQGQGAPDEIPEMLSEPESLPDIPSRATDMVTLELPTLTETEGKAGKEPQEKKPGDQAPLPGSKAPTTQFKTGQQESRASKPEQYLPNWIVNLFKQKTTQTSTEKGGQKRK